MRHDTLFGKILRLPEGFFIDDALVFALVNIPVFDGFQRAANAAPVFIGEIPLIPCDFSDVNRIVENPADGGALPICAIMVFYAEVF